MSSIPYFPAGAPGPHPDESTDAKPGGLDPQIKAIIDELLENAGCSVKAQMQIDVAIDELFGNIAHYAYPGGAGDAAVRFSLDEAARTATITFIDSGVPFNPLAQDEPDVTLSADKRTVGGLGIYLVRKTMDRVDYQRRDGMNILTITKTI